MKTVYRAILQVGSAHPKFVSITIQSGTLQTIAGQWWVEMPGGYMTKHDDRWCDSEAEAWNMAAIGIEAIACGFGDRAQDCRDMADAAKAVPA
jgi:hypothetical protein